MKYEAVFGNQSLFDGAPEDAEYVSIDGNGDQLVFYKDIAVGDYYSFFDRNSSHWRINDGHPYYSIKAMRRIIQEPKRWTVENKKAGRLPEVGTEILGRITGVNTVIFNNGDFVVVLAVGGAVGKYDKAEVFEYFTPIETPEEKAERIREEWINEAINVVQKTHLNGYESIYEALLSGALSVPTKGGE